MQYTVHPQNWVLDTIFPGGSQSIPLQNHVHQLDLNITQLENTDPVYQPLKHHEPYIKETIKNLSPIKMNLSEANSFIICLLAEDSNDQHAITLKGKINTLQARFDTYLRAFQSYLNNISESTWGQIIISEALSDYQFILNEWREKGSLHFQQEQGELVSDLMVDGYHAWGDFYQSLIQKTKITINEDYKEISVGQAINLRAHPDKQLRKQAQESLESALQEKEDLFANVLNHIAGFRLELYNKRGIGTILDEPLFENRMKRETLDAMWSAVAKYKQPFVKYLQHKAKLLGEENMHSYNFWSPIAKGSRTIEYGDAVEFIKRKFSSFGTELECFARHAFDHGWVETENRPSKRVGGFCAGFPSSGESRIFMTYSGTISNVLTLAHELGHAFHNHALKNVNGLYKSYPLSMAEMASTFSEMIILDAAQEETLSKEEKLFLLDEKLKRSVMNFMHMHTRYLFEQNFYEERKNGLVSSTRLNELMLEAYNTGYAGSLEGPSARTWIWTPHYYLTDKPFYNFPYTFGYLFSLSIYARAKEIGRNFEEDYLAILRDSGSITAEDLVMKHLNEDITTESFWEKGIQLCIKDVEEFIHLTT